MLAAFVKLASASPPGSSQNQPHWGYHQKWTGVSANKPFKSLEHGFGERYQ